MSRSSKAYWIAAAALMALPVLASAQGYYDDDIYYNPAKDKKAAKPAKETYTPAAVQQTYAPADTYVFNTGSNFDVDAYNRRGQFLVSDTTAYDDGTQTDYFANTRRIERFHNSDIVVNSGDDALISYYFTQPSTVNIYIDNDPWYFPRWSWSWAYINPLYSWTWGYYDPWWNPVWGWSWTSAWGPGWGPSWSWGWGPSWAWGWGPGWRPGGWGPGWGPGWHPGPGHGPGWNPGPSHGNDWAYRPTGAGSSRPHAYTGGASSSRNPGSAQGTIRPGQTSRPTGGIANTGRPASTYNGSAAANTGRPASGSQHQATSAGELTVKPDFGTSNTPSYGSNSGTRGRNNYGSGTSTTNNRNNYNSNSNRGTSNSGSYNNSNRGSSNTGRGSSYNSNSNSNRNANTNSNRSNNNSNRSSYNSNSGSSNTGRSGYSSGGGGGGSRGGNTGGGSRSTGGGGGGRGRR